MRIAVIVNQCAGGVAGEMRDDQPAQFEQALRGVGVDATLRCVSPESVGREIEEALRTAPDVIAVGGGDGTLSTAAGLLAGSRTALGILPLGTLNHFAKDLKIPTDWKAAVALLGQLPPRGIDVAEVNGRVFINNCSLGAYPEAVRRREAARRTRGHGKWRAMIVASWQVLPRLRRMRVELQTDNAHLRRRTPFIIVGNNRYSGPLFSSSYRARLDEGRLWVYTTHVHRTFPLLCLVFRSLAFNLDDANELECTPAEKLRVTLDHEPVLLAVDGEMVKMDGPLRFQIRPRALRVIAPPSAA